MSKDQLCVQRELQEKTGFLCSSPEFVQVFMHERFFFAHALEADQFSASTWLPAASSEQDKALGILSGLGRGCMASTGGPRSQSA